MLSLGSLVFASPWMLLSLTTLPIIWWILRITPPPPKIQPFPPLLLMGELNAQEETPAGTPFWLLIFRLLIAAIIICALARPIWNAGEKFSGTGPVVIVIDDGWSAAPNWSRTIRAGLSIVDQAEREGRAAILITTAPNQSNGKVEVTGLLRPQDIRKKLKAMQPVPWPKDLGAAANAVAELKLEGSAQVGYLSDGHGNSSLPKLIGLLQERGSMQLFVPEQKDLARLIKSPISKPGGLSVKVLRAQKQGEMKLHVRIDDKNGRLLSRSSSHFPDGQNSAEVIFSIPSEVKNKAARISVEGNKSAGSIFLLDENWRRRPVGIVSRDGRSGSQPLLSSEFYIMRALEPFSETFRGPINNLLKRDLSMLILADAINLTGAETKQALIWLESGGVLLRFAGPGLGRTDPSLMPVKLRNTGRALGGTMSWSKPAKLMPFHSTSPFAGLEIPPDIRIKKQILAEPTQNLRERTWARLSDGTPLVTAKQVGEGWLVLVHVTANTEWSNLPISGLFIKMLNRIIALSRGMETKTGDLIYPPLQTMDGFGVLGAPPPQAISIRGKTYSNLKTSYIHPPGYYGTKRQRITLNLSSGVDNLTPLENIPNGVELKKLSERQEIEFKPSLLLIAMILVILDLFISLAIRGLKPHFKTRQNSVLGCLGFLLLIFTIDLGAEANAQGLTGLPKNIVSSPQTPQEKLGLRATLGTHLAYVITGNAKIDSVSRAGMEGLSVVLQSRTAIEPGKPIGVNLEKDELAFFTVLYWPVVETQRNPSDAALSKLNNYLRTGGTILFDTREQGSVNTNILGMGSSASAKLRNLIGELDVPPLMQVPPDHVLTKAFYLLDRFPGRWAGGTVWVERRGGNHNDGVSSIIIGSHDWAGAWARDKNGLPMFAVVPNGERQREYAFRFGVNWIMYAMTGNYKTDQVHVPSIIERLGQ
ncbi:MAG: DUF4159 domain-containing protein [Rhodospirillaceae bacterium]